MKKQIQTEFHSYRTRIILLLALSLTFYSLTSYLLAHFLVHPALIKLEQSLAAKEIKNFFKLINNDIIALDTITNDWAVWDDTYAFVQHPNEEYLKSNFTDGTFINGKFNLIAIYNLEGEVVVEKIIDLKSIKHINIKPFSPNGLTKDHFLLKFKGVNDFHRGIMATEQGPLLIAARPIVTSDNEGPIRGTILFGRFFFPHISDMMAQYENLTVQATPTNRLDPDQKAILKQLQTTPLIFRNHTDLLTIYSSLPALNGKPIIFFTFNIKRNIIQQVHLTLKYVILFNIIIGIILIGIFLIVFNKITLPVQRLLKKIQSFTYPRSQAVAKDNTTQSTSFNTAIQLLSTDFVEKKKEQEQFILHRTSDLQEANRLLGQEITKRINTEKKLLESQNQLEEKIAQRTLDLTQLTLELQKEILEREEYETKLKEQQKQLRRLSSQLHNLAEKERRKIATDLHDRIGQSLSAIKIFLDTLAETDLSNHQDNNVQKMTRILQQTIEDTRTMTFEISPPVLYELGLEQALEWYLDTLYDQMPLLKIDLQCDNQPYDQISITIQSMIFQIARELLTNVVKHSGADYAVIKTSFVKEIFTLLVQDNGHGFNPDDKPMDKKVNKGFGLFNIRERLTPMDGSMTVNSRPGKGTEIIISIPIAALQV